MLGISVMTGSAESHRSSRVRVGTRLYSHIFPIKVTADTIGDICFYISRFTAIHTDRNRADTRVYVLEVEGTHTGTSTIIQQRREVGTLSTRRCSLENDTHFFAGIFLQIHLPIEDVFHWIISRIYHIRQCIGNSFSEIGRDANEYRICGIILKSKEYFCRLVFSSIHTGKV